MLNREQLKKIIDNYADKFVIEKAMLEKDYYLMLILRELAKREPYIIFKGGTSLSKAYKTINRFSEDLDVTLKVPYTTESNRKKINKQIEDVCFNYFKFKQRKEQENHPIRHKGLSNIYYIDYNPVYESNMKTFIELDCSFITKVEDCEKKQINCFLGEQINVDEESFKCFEIYVQSPEMILADKFFAICKNYRRGNVRRYSRHFYDIYNTYTKIIKGKSENKLKEYIKNVAEEEKEKYSIITEDKKIIKEKMADVLIEAMKYQPYKEDYITDLPQYVYSNKIPKYEECCKLILELIKKGWFDNIYHYFVGKVKPIEVKTYIYEFIDGTKKEIKNLTQQEFQGKYCKNNKDLADKKINELKELLRDKGKMFDETRYYMIPVKEGSNTYFIVGQNIRRTIALEIVKKELKIK